MKTPVVTHTVKPTPACWVADVTHSTTQFCRVVWLCVCGGGGVFAFVHEVPRHIHNQQRGGTWAVCQNRGWHS